jgi:elongator complex protein 1
MRVSHLHVSQFHQRLYQATADILLTPFRTQNVPPPMSSYKLTVSPTWLKTAQPAPRVPIHVSFSSCADTLAVLWESGYVELWDLQTRLESGRGDAMKPVLAWSANVTANGTCRQVSVLGQDVVVVSSGSKKDCDFIHVVDVPGRGSSTQSIQLPSMNGRLVQADRLIVWQARDGQLYHGRVS